MRRCFLATTALVALGGVSAASADVTLSGKTMFNFTSWSTSQSDPNGAKQLNHGNFCRGGCYRICDDRFQRSDLVNQHRVSDNTENLSLSGDGWKLICLTQTMATALPSQLLRDPVADEDYGGNTITYNGNEAVVGGDVS